jgi:hypothetical protein
MPLNESLSIMGTVDQIRAQCAGRQLQDHPSQPEIVLRFPV